MVTPTARRTSDEDDRNRERAKRLGLYGLVENWDEVSAKDWIETLLEMEEAERKRRSLERRLRNAKCGRFKPICDFDWSWPRKIDRELIEELFGFSFLKERANVVLIGQNGVGKTMIARNLAHEATLKGFTVRCVGASQMLSELMAQDGPAGLERRLKRYTRPSLLYLDEVGYLSYDTRHADLLFEIVNRRQDKSTVITTNRPFSEWNEVFPNAASVVALIDRLVHRSEIVEIDAESYRLKEAKERAQKRQQARKAKKRAASRRKKT